MYYAHVNSLSVLYRSCMFHGNNLYTVIPVVKSTLCVQLLDKYLTCFLIAVLPIAHLLRTSKCFFDHLVQFHSLNACVISEMSLFNCVFQICQ